MILFLFCVGLVGVVWQPEMMRPLSAESPKVARRVFWISSATVMGRAMVPMFWGIAALAYFGNPELDPHYAMPEMLGNILPIGIAGLLMGRDVRGLHVHPRQLSAGLEWRHRPRCGFAYQGHARKIERRARSRRNLGRAIERARDLLDPGYRRHPRCLTWPFSARSTSCPRRLSALCTSPAVSTSPAASAPWPWGCTGKRPIPQARTAP